jgi:hypothetical protein
MQATNAFLVDKYADPDHLKQNISIDDSIFNEMSSTHLILSAVVEIIQPVRDSPSLSQRRLNPSWKYLTVRINQYSKKQHHVDSLSRLLLIHTLALHN